MHDSRMASLFSASKQLVKICLHFLAPKKGRWLLCTFTLAWRGCGRLLTRILRWYRPRLRPPGVYMRNVYLYLPNVCIYVCI